MQISLTDLEFFGFHGLYEGEKKTGNIFKVDVIIDFNPKTEMVGQLNQTIDYVQVYQTIKSIMDIPTPLLETIVGKIATSILAAHPIASHVKVSITKQKLLIPYFEGNTTVTFEKTRS